MVRLLCLAMLLTLTACASTDSADSPKASKQVLNYEKANADYVSLAQSIIAEEAGNEVFDKILRLFPLTSFYEPNANTDERVKQASANYMQASDWFMCLRINQQLLNVNYTSFTGHYGMAICSEEVRDSENAAFHNWVLDNFIEAIWRSGDGQSPDTAFYINSTSDLIAFVQLHQLQVIGQELIYHQQIPIQKVRVQNPDNLREYDWYFNMTAQFRKAYIDSLEAR